LKVASDQIRPRRDTNISVSTLNRHFPDEAGSAGWENVGIGGSGFLHAGHPVANSVKALNRSSDGQNKAELSCGTWCRLSFCDYFELIEFFWRLIGGNSAF